MHSTVSIRIYHGHFLFSFSKLVCLFLLCTLIIRCVSRFSTHFGTLCLKHISALGWNTDEVWMCLP